jgi:hypothetical protein
MIRWIGEPDRCTCTRMIVEDLADTLGCPAGWRFVAGTGWCHNLWERWIARTP